MAYYQIKELAAPPMGKVDRCRFAFLEGLKKMVCSQIFSTDSFHGGRNGLLRKRVGRIKGAK